MAITGKKDSEFDEIASWASGSLIAILSKQGDGSYLNKNIDIALLTAAAAVTFASVTGNPEDNAALKTILDAIRAQITALQGSGGIKRWPAPTQTDMLALEDAVAGDEAVRFDQGNKIYILSGGVYSDPDAWIPIELPDISLDDLVDATGRDNNYIIRWDAVNNKAYWAASSGGATIATDTQFDNNNATNAATPNQVNTRGENTIDITIEEPELAPGLDMTDDKTTPHLFANWVVQLFSTLGGYITSLFATVGEISTALAGKVDIAGGPVDNTVFTPDDQDNDEGFWNGIGTGATTADPVGTVKSKDAWDRVADNAEMLREAIDLKANDAEVVHLEGNETIDGIKTFLQAIGLPFYDAITIADGTGDNAGAFGGKIRFYNVQEERVLFTINIDPSSFVIQVDDETETGSLFQQLGISLDLTDSNYMRFVGAISPTEQIVMKMPKLDALGNAFVALFSQRNNGQIETAYYLPSSGTINANNSDEIYVTRSVSANFTLAVSNARVGSKIVWTVTKTVSGDVAVTLPSNTKKLGSATLSGASGSKFSIALMCDEIVSTVPQFLAIINGPFT